MLHNRVPKPRQWQGHQACVVGSAANASTACVAIVAPEFDAATHLGERSRTGSSRPWLERAEEELAAGDAGTALERAAALVVSGLWRSTRRSGQSGRRAERERKGGKSSGRLNRAPGWEWDGSRGSGAVIESTNAPCFSFGTRFWVGWVLAFSRLVFLAAVSAFAAKPMAGGSTYTRGCCLRDRPVWLCCARFRCACLSNTPPGRIGGWVEEYSPSN
jgi:hypothetical protein